MPEGPEVETIRVGLLPIVGHTIEEVIVADHKKYRPHEDAIHSLEGYEITDITRRGKFMVFYFKQENNEMAALNHLGMTGVWYLYSDKVWNEFDAPFEKYNHYKVYFRLSGDKHLLFVNVRTFGRFVVYTPSEIEEHPSISSLGPDILAEEFDTTEFISRMRGQGHRKRTKAVGKCLLDYTIVAGCGNIYKNETLHMSEIHPMTPANELNDDQLRELADNLSKVAQTALKFKGSTLQDFKHVDGYSGLMQNKFLVYGKDGEPCSTCGTMIVKGSQGNRTSFWCPSCQDNLED